MPGRVAVVIPAKNEADRIGATVSAAAGLPDVHMVVVVDDGSTDKTAASAAAAGAYVIRHGKNRGKGAAVQTGAEAVRLMESPGAQGDHHLLLLDADLGDSAAAAGPLIEPVMAGTADMTIAVIRLGSAGFGILTSTAAAGIQRATGWRPTQPLNGQRCLTRAAFTAALPLAAGWGLETGLTIDLMRKGMRITEVEVPLSHRVTGNDWRSHVHRIRQLVGVLRALAAREPETWRLRRRQAGRSARPRWRGKSFLKRTSPGAGGDAHGDGSGDDAIMMR